MNKQYHDIFLILISTVFVFSCSKKPLEKNENVEKNGFVITDDDQELDSRIVRKQESIELKEVEDTTLVKSGSATSCVDSLSFSLITEVSPPVYEGDTLQASHVIIKNNFAFVTYNTQGEKYLGGVEVFDVSDLDNPVIIWSAILPEGDISAVDFYNDKIYLVGAQNLDFDEHGLENPAFLDVINLNDQMEMEGRDTIVSLLSYVGTDIRVEENRIYTTSGSDGFFNTFDFDYNVLYSEQIDYARSVDFSSNYVCVLKSDPGEVKKYKRSDFSFYFDINVGGVTIPESKSELIVTNSYFITALNDGGVKAMSYGGSLLFSIDTPKAPLGENQDNYVSNSISINKNLLFIANGEAGIYVVCIDADPVKIVGAMQFEKHSSVNFVESKEDVLFAATGKGGLKIVKMEK